MSTSLFAGTRGKGEKWGFQLIASKSSKYEESKGDETLFRGIITSSLWSFEAF
jgi:hypothetical protein